MLKRIEISGFKSFAKKTELSFDTPVTAVVGPNGSGKSNIVESIRFVLGEQSNKSLRSKSGADLIFKGSKTLSQQNRAYVKIVFDNRNKIFRLGEGTSTLDYDDVEIAREIFRDGGSKYTLNGSEIRLKDVTELLSSVNIGASGHHIISQGEADRILSANARERREMIEDALGLKLYQYRLRESERKLEKTEVNMKEVDALRREIAPHLRYLKKQMEKIEYAKELSSKLTKMYESYLSVEKAYIEHKKAELETGIRENNEKKIELQKKLEGVKERSEIDALAPVRQVLGDTERALVELRGLKTQSERSLARLETLLEVAKARATAPEKPKEGFVSIGRTQLIAFKEALVTLIDEAKASGDMETLRAKLASIRSHLDGFTSKYLVAGGDILQSQVAVDTKDEQAKLEKEIADTRLHMEKLFEREEVLVREKEELERKIEISHESRVLEERTGFELRVLEQELLGRERVLMGEENELRHTEELFNEELREGGALLGTDILYFADQQVPAETERTDRRLQEERRREIERVKIKLEEAGMGGATDVMKEYEEVLARDQFLEKELRDLGASIEKIQDVIRELKDTIDREFRIGIDKINKVFQEFFALMFGGGRASLAVAQPEKKKKKDEDDEEVANDNPEEPTEAGIDIDISLPHKKVKELMMLSGGERSLTSIALLFAMSQVNPPPFLVLDETDAALDEANSRRYGDMIQKLSEFSELIVVTHNRETMSRAQVLYGITLGADSASKLLSVKLDDAVRIAK